MTDTKLVNRDLASLGPMIESGQVSPVELTAAVLDHIERRNGTLNAFTSVYPELAMAQAREAEANIQNGQYLGPLHGIPLAVKDLYLVAGMRRTCGSGFLREDPSPMDATAVARLRAAGAIIVGLLNLNEFAYGTTGINPHVGSARNPWNPDYACGGSSSGSGCAVAASLIAAAMGTDTGGSIRIPASLTGVVGLKQTYGLVSRAGIYPLSESFDHGGPLTRTVRDAALMLQTIAGEDEADSTTWRVPVGDYTVSLGKSIRGKRIGIPKQYFFEDLHPETETRVRTAINALADLGAEICQISLPFAAEVFERWVTISAPEAYTVHKQHVLETPGALAPEVEARVLLGRDISAHDYVKARNFQDHIKRETAALMEDIDVIVTPTTPLPAPHIDTGCLEINGQTVDGAKVLARFTRFADFTGQPAISLPCGFSEKGMPIGLQMMGRWFDEENLLSVAQAYESVTPWHQERPKEL
jgi:aspartyl-tRNA(Asn)/glutamyl-tRNA(Gln) amidotransferase subunit A